MPLRIGIVGLDSSHAVSLVRRCNVRDADSPVRVIAGWPGGSSDAPLSAERVIGFTDEVRDRCGVEILESPEAVATAVDAVAILSMDGRNHAQLFARVASFRRPVFVNKPLATSRHDAERIAETARKHGVRWFSASALRLAAVSAPPARRVTVQCPLWFEPANVGWFWYGIHGIELAAAVCGRGISAVRLETFPDRELLHLEWRDGHTGTVVGLLNRDAAFTYACDDATAVPVGAHADRLEQAMLDFFAGADAPVTTADTLEVIACVAAANASRASDGRRISL
ncbi:Gfo/Idh/MocA family oxidoreductase [Opitutus terrae]|uniref:Oxidoreductase domain protein n=1 Tax=Opitutus terrae (strain DSM 11246 / JCM 15787 / PB90-1) TaxID=452637 RepID=B1ZY51_OPITP|nr:Gfo/Idh/MocA family oxidoreductase [Opitutus terrae]ACB76200.1 oxidoreductase domain protein [Opitutus terrae PB90-1]